MRLRGGGKPHCSTCKCFARIRICAKCGKRMGRHHKYFFNGTQVQHRDCENPEQREASEQLQGEMAL